MLTDDELKLLRIKTTNKEELKQNTSTSKRFKLEKLKLVLPAKKRLIAKSEFHINNSSNIIIFLFAKSAHPTSSGMLITLWSSIQNSSSTLFKCADLGQKTVGLEKRGRVQHPAITASLWLYLEAKFTGMMYINNWFQYNLILLSINLHMYMNNDCFTKESNIEIRKIYQAFLIYYIPESNKSGYESHFSFSRVILKNLQNFSQSSTFVQWEL